MRRGPLTSLLVIVVIAIGSLAYTLVAGNSPQLGLDLQGGASVVLRPKVKVNSGALQQAISIIRNRVDGLGVAEADVHAEGQNIIVQLPGVKDQKRALDLVGQTAELRFRPVLEAVPLSTAPVTVPKTTTTTAKAGTTTTTAKAATTTTAKATSTTAAPATLRAAGAGPALAQSASTSSTTATTAKATATTAKATATTAGTTATTAATTATTTATTAPVVDAIPTTSREDDKADAVVVLPLQQKGTITGRYRLGPAELTGKAIKSATASFDSTGGTGWRVDFTTTSSGSKAFDAMAAKNLQKQVAIVLDGVVKSAPVIQQAQFNGRGQISGSFSEKEAKDLALVLRYGSLPVELKPETVQTVSASLGKDSLHAGVLAGLLGLGLVLVYMILYYRALGIVVVCGLTVSGMLMWSIVSFLGVHNGLALSLAGAVGIIVSVGVTVDSYVVYFERLKDEIRAGKTIRSSVDRGFARAYRTILAADTASLIGAALLYFLTVGSVRGFAFFLGLSTVLDMLVAYTFTRPMVIVLGRNRVFTEARWLGIARGLAAPAPSGSAS